MMEKNQEIYSKGSFSSTLNCPFFAAQMTSPFSQMWLLYMPVLWLKMGQSIAYILLHVYLFIL